MHYYSPEDDAKIIQMIGAGASKLAVAKAIGRSKSSAYYRIELLRGLGRLPKAKKPEEAATHAAKRSSDAFLDALKASETAPKTLPIPETRHPQRIKPALEFSFVGSPAALCGEN
jgi:hypothetical protein